MTQTVIREEEKILITPPIRGMNTNDPPHRLPEGQGVEAYNVEIDEVLGIGKRSGFTTFNTASTLIPRYVGGTIKEITGPMVYLSGSALTGSVCKTSDVFFVKGNSSAVFWQIANLVGTATLSLAVAYSQTVTASSYILGPKEVTSLFNYKYGTTQKLLAFAGSDGFVATADQTGSFSAITAALTDYQNVNGASFQDVFYFCNGYEFKYYNGSAVSSVSGSPAPTDPKYVGVYTIGNANYLAIAGSNTDANKSMFAFSDVNAAGTWPVANRYYAGDRDGTAIIGQAPIPGGWIIFKEDSIFGFSGIPGGGSLRKICDDVGCVAEKTIVPYEGKIYFVGRKGGVLGVYVFDGTPNVVCLSTSIEKTLNALSLGNISKFCAEIYNNKYVFGARTSSGTYNDQHYVCYIDRPFQGFAGINFPWVRGNRKWASILTQNVSGTTYLFSGSPVNGFVYRENTGTVDDITCNILGGTSAINAYVDTAWLDFGDNSKRKELLRAYIDATQSGNWNLVFGVYKDFESYGSDDYNVNLGSNVMLWSQIVYLVTPWQTAVDKSVTELFFNYPNIGTFFKFRWANANASEPFSVYPATFYLKRENR